MTRVRLPRLLAVLAAVALSAATYAQRPPACPEFAARLPNLPLRLCQQMEQFRPHLVVAIHAPYGGLDFDGPSVPPSRLGRLYLDQVGISPGSVGNYGGVHKGVPVVTIELPNAQRTPLDAEMRQMWIDLLRWMAGRLPVGTTGR